VSGEPLPSDDAGGPADAAPKTLPAPDAGSPYPGAVTEIGSCDEGLLPSAACLRVAVECPDTTTLGAKVLVVEPAGPPVAAIVIATGGPGTWNPDKLAPEQELIPVMAAAGYLAVTFGWDEPGWFVGGAGVHASSCRFAALLRWIAGRYRPQGGRFCAMGGSGGAIEIAYALARWDAAEFLDGAVLSDGPSMTRMDLLCPSVAPASWVEEECPALVGRYLPSSCLVAPQPTCIFREARDYVDYSWSPGHPCTSADEGSASLEALRADGVLAPDSRLVYPRTRVRFVLGAEECHGGMILYYDAVLTAGNDSTLTVVDSAGHGVNFTEQGVEATLQAIKSACVAF
jgi:hypothetical protein